MIDSWALLTPHHGSTKTPGSVRLQVDSGQTMVLQHHFMQRCPNRLSPLPPKHFHGEMSGSLFCVLKPPQKKSFDIRMIALLSC